MSDTRIGAWGISYGGGAVFNSLVAGVPWAAVGTAQTWTDLGSALFPQGLVKSGLVAGLSSSIPDARRDPSLASLTAAAYAGDLAGVRPWAAARSSLAKLGTITTPVFMAQGRRDFLFGIDQGVRVFNRLKGPKVLYVGLHGHAPSTFPAADTGYLMSQVHAWFDCFLAQTPCSRAQAAFALAPETFSGGTVPWRGTLPPVSPTFVSFPGVTTFARQRQGGTHLGAAPEADRDLRSADRADLHRSERRLVAARCRAHRADSRRQGDPRERRRRPDEAWRAEGHHPAHNQATLVPRARARP